MTDYTRQRDWYDPYGRDSDAVTIVGCGGIGSFTAIALAKLGVPRFHLIDPDVVEDHNIPNQHFSECHVGMPKVDALAQQLSAIAEPTITTVQDRFSQSNLVMAPVIIAGLDSMAARSALWDLVRMKLPVKRFIDGRLAGQQIVHYVVRPTNITDVKGYQRTLYSDAEALADSCTARSIIDVAFQIASLNVRATRLALTQPDRRLDPITYVDQDNMRIASGEWIND